MSIMGYMVIEQVETSIGSFPLVNIPLMDDERWQELARENAVHNFIHEHGCKPESTEKALQWQRARYAAH